jgi:hypothetical protein
MTSNLDAFVEKFSVDVQEDFIGMGTGADSVQLPAADGRRVSAEWRYDKPCCRIVKYFRIIYIPQFEKVSFLPCPDVRSHLDTRG